MAPSLTIACSGGSLSVEQEIFQSVGPMLRTKAKKIATVLKNTSFKTSNGWLEAFQCKHDLFFKALVGEAAGMDMGVVQNWTKNVDFLLRDYELKNIFNLNETGLYW